MVRRAMLLWALIVANPADAIQVQLCRQLKARVEQACGLAALRQSENVDLLRRTLQCIELQVQTTQGCDGTKSFLRSPVKQLLVTHCQPSILDGMPGYTTICTQADFAQRTRCLIEIAKRDSLPGCVPYVHRYFTVIYPRKLASSAAKKRRAAQKQGQAEAAAPEEADDEEEDEEDDEEEDEEDDEEDEEDDDEEDDEEDEEDNEEDNEEDDEEDNEEDNEEDDEEDDE